MDTIRYTEATSKDILEILNLIEPAVEGKPATHVNMACIALVLFNMNHDITLEQMVQGVKDVSEWVGLYVAGQDGTVLHEA